MRYSGTEMIVYYESTERYTHGIEAFPDGLYPDRSPEYYTWKLASDFTARPAHSGVSHATAGRIEGGSWVDAEDLPPGTEIFAVLVRYGSGDTFVESHGHGTVACVCTDLASAEEAVRFVERGESPVNPKGFARWSGYFESLESVEILRTVLR